mmetsp:Transcript_32556/g.70285  ORF Transcript_32556/g.70285 Transcript_32556/m.70285 type:complete len:107 (-) Transcript_32556:176-496(-)
MPRHHHRCQARLHHRLKNERRRNYSLCILRRRRALRLRRAIHQSQGNDTRSVILLDVDPCNPELTPPTPQSENEKPHVGNVGIFSQSDNREDKLLGILSYLNMIPL